jgi:hypothetical protein
MSKITGKELRAIIDRLFVTQINMPQIPKTGNKTCWAGCYRMVDAYNASPRKYKQYLALQNPTCTIAHCEINPCVGCDQPRATTDILNDLHSLGYRGSSRIGSYLNAGAIKLHLKAKSPLMVFKDQGSAIGHYQLLTGIATKFRGFEPFVVVNDPDHRNVRFVDCFDFSFEGGRWADTWVVAI